MKDPTAHAEMNAIREAAQHMGTGDMRGCVMYANCDPCPMCAGAAMYSGIGTVSWRRSRSSPAVLQRAI